jgi:phospholipid/cholesterol/gamma-HCH transport system substrate-binding protein
MRRNTVIAQLIVFGVISIVVISFAVFQLLGVRVLHRPYTVTVQLHNAGGIFADAEVNYRGVSVGRVDTLRLGTGGVTITLKIDHGVKIPANSIAHIENLSAVGEQYVNFVPPAKPSASYLRDGDVVPVGRTTVPLRTAAVLYDLEKFIDSVSPADIQVIGREGAAAFQGTGPQLKQLLSGATRIVDELSATQGATVDLIHNAAILLHSAAAHASQFDDFTRALAQLTDTFAASTPTIEKFLDQSVPTTTVVNDLIRTNGNAIGVLLANGATLSQIQVARVPGLRSLLVAVPLFGRLAPQVVVDGTLNGIVEVDRTDPVCATGVPLTSPLSGIRTDLRSVRCPAFIVRGAANAPRPGTSASSVEASALLTPDRSAQVAAYDPASGLVSTADGQFVRLVSNGGQAGYLGRNSWQALLLAGIGQ